MVKQRGKLRCIQWCFTPIYLQLHCQLKQIWECLKAHTSIWACNQSTNACQSHLKASRRHAVGGGLSSDTQAHVDRHFSLLQTSGWGGLVHVVLQRVLALLECADLAAAGQTCWRWRQEAKRVSAAAHPAEELRRRGWTSLLDSDETP